MKKIFIFFLTILLSYCLAVFLSSPVHAQDAPAENWVDGDYAGCMTGEDGALVTGGMCAPAYASHMQTNFSLDFVRKSMGPIPGLTITEHAYKNNPRLVTQMRQGSAVSGIGNYIATMYKYPPANTGLFLADIGQTLGFLPKQAYAQGIGFSGLSALLPIWKAFRNIAYVLMALVLVVIGFMVMLRKKIDPKTVVTIQNALPKIVITLLLITFSYAIVGIMIDLMYISLFLVVSIFKSTGLVPDLPVLAPIKWAMGYKSVDQVITTGGLGAIYNLLFPFWGLSMTDLAFDLLGGWSTVISGAIGGGLVGLLTPAGLAGGAAGALIGGAAIPVLGTLLISLAVVFTFIRLLFLFINAYIQIILSLLIGPLHILFEAVPGSTAFSSWFKNLFSNIIVFPIAGALFLISYIFSAIADPTLVGVAQSGRVWSPPYLAIISNPQSHSIAALFSLGVLMVIPTVVGGIKEALKAKPVIPAGPGAIFAPITGAYQTAQGALSQFYYGEQILGPQGTIGKIIRGKPKE